MRVKSEFDEIQLVKIQSKERLVTARQKNHLLVVLGTSLLILLCGPFLVHAGSGTTNLIVAYTAEPVANGQILPDDEVPFYLIDGRYWDLSYLGEGVQYNSDVAVITANLGSLRPVKKITLYGFHFYSANGNAIIASVTIAVSADNKTWKEIAVLENDRSPRKDAEALPIAFSTEVNEQAKFVRYTVKRGKDSTRIILGEIIVE